MIATRSGGASIFFTLFFISSLLYLFNLELYNFSILVPLTILMFVGLYDDINEVDFKLKFIFQIVVAKILVDNGLLLDNLHGVFGINGLDRISAQVITIFIIVAIINSINFIDGIDGLAISVVTLFLILFEIFSASDSSFIYLSTILIFSLIPIFYFNYRREKKIFLGDSGSLFLGGVVSIYTLHVLSSDYIISQQYDINKIFFVISILFYPIVDIIRVVFLRLVNKKSPFMADKNHIHHRLLAYFQNHVMVNAVIILSSIIIMFLIQIVL